jgi:hypothetical protein
MYPGRTKWKAFFQRCYFYCSIAWTKIQQMIMISEQSQKIYCCDPNKLHYSGWSFCWLCPPSHRISINSQMEVYGRNISESFQTVIFRMLNWTKSVYHKLSSRNYWKYYVEKVLHCVYHWITFESKLGLNTFFKGAQSVI